jgi:hypothetical protein
MCCNHHNSGSWEPFTSNSIQTHYLNSANEFVMTLKKYFTVTIFDKNIKLDFDNIKVDEEKIVFNEKIPRIHFAGCGYEDYCDLTSSNYVKGIKHNMTALFNLPPIFYKETEHGYHLKLDFFKNDFKRKKKEVTINYPELYDYIALGNSGSDFAPNYFNDTTSQVEMRIENSRNNQNSLEVAKSIK